MLYSTAIKPKIKKCYDLDDSNNGKLDLIQTERFDGA
jgi:hypothetical protein